MLDELVLRCLISNKKYDFFLQCKLAQKSEAISLLEGTSFSKLNPYFIVQYQKCVIYVLSDLARKVSLPFFLTAIANSFRQK